MSKSDNDGVDPPQTREKTGYGNPPMRRRFIDCGNKKGRPKGSKNRKTIVNEIANEMHTVLENGNHKQRSTLELIIIQLRNRAMEAKDIRAFDELHRLEKAYQPQATRDGAGVLVVPAPLNNLAWIRREENNNRFKISPMERNDRAKKVREANPDMSDLEANEQVSQDLKVDKARILEAEKRHRAEEILKADPTIDHAEAINRAEAERRAWLNGDEENQN